MSIFQQKCSGFDAKPQEGDKIWTFWQRVVLQTCFGRLLSKGNFIFDLSWVFFLTKIATHLHFWGLTKIAHGFYCNLKSEKGAEKTRPRTTPWRYFLPITFEADYVSSFASTRNLKKQFEFQLTMEKEYRRNSKACVLLVDFKALWL